MAVYPEVREIAAPVTVDQLTPLDARVTTIQFAQPLSDADHQLLAPFVRKYPHVTLRVYKHYLERCDLGFLRHYPFVRHLMLQGFMTDDFTPMKYVSADLETLTLGQTKGKRHSLAFLERFTKLRRLYLECHSKDIAVIGKLSHLEHLTLRSITLPDLSILKPLEGLRSLDIKLGGTKDLGLLPKIGRLRYLELWMIKGLCDLTPIASVKTLQYLFLQALKNVERLPPMTRLPLLRRVYLEAMKGLTDLKPVAMAPAIEELMVVDMGHLDAEAFRPFVNHRTLKRATIGLGSQRKNQAVADLLGLPAASGEFVFDGD